MKIYIDVHYREEKAKVVCAEFYNWEDTTANSHEIAYLENIEEYIPGEFYKRELPCILKILENYNLEDLELIVIDGFVLLDNNDKPGLGHYLYEALDKKIPVIGVAKSGFHQNTKNVVDVLRGESSKPLFVSAVGIDLKEASMCIKKMSGNFRMPDILQVVDRKTKEK